MEKETVVHIVESSSSVIDELLNTHGGFFIDGDEAVLGWAKARNLEAPLFNKLVRNGNTLPQAVRPSPNRIVFTTYGNSPIETLEKLPEAFPSEKIVYAYAGGNHLLGEVFGLLVNDDGVWERKLEVPKGSAVALQFSHYVFRGIPYTDKKVETIREAITSLENKYLTDEAREKLGVDLAIEKQSLDSLRRELRLFWSTVSKKDFKLKDVNWEDFETYLNF